MSFNSPREPWPRLVSAARQVTDDRDTAAPYGFATRVAAPALSSERRVASLFERFALRAVGVACLLAIASIAINYSAFTRSASSEEPVAAADDPMSILLDA
jgi:hypothetical protein